MVGLLSLSPARWICARRKAQAEGRLYSFQAQKLNLISNINLFSLRSRLSVPALFLFLALFSFHPPRAAGALPIRIERAALTLYLPGYE